jgi:DNA-binding protein Fis
MDRFLESRNKTVRQITKSLNSAKRLFISSIVIGEKNIGKETLVRKIFSGLPVVSAKNGDLVTEILTQNSEVIITDFEYFSYPSDIELNKKRIVATAGMGVDEKRLDDIFAFIYHMPSLSDRPEDISLFADHFLENAKRELMIEGETVLDYDALNLSENLLSLKASVYREAVWQDIDERKLEKTLYSYFKKTLSGDDTDAYRKNLGIFERALIKAGLELYGSQLRLSEILGINRNTLRKKINEYDIHRL